MEKNEKDIYLRIQKECFWDYNISPEDIERIVRKGDEKEVGLLFKKIVDNISDISVLKKVFREDIIKKHLEIMMPGGGKVRDRILILKNIYLDEKNIISRLEWNKYV